MNAEDESLYNRIRQVFGEIPKSYNILEEQIDIALQMEYFKLSKNLKKTIDKEAVLANKELLFDSETTIEEKKKLLVQLASIDSVEAFRTIEKYLKNPDESIRNWTTLAVQECKVLLQSKLLNEEQIFISTGLGGKGSKLRYFIVFIMKGDYTREYTPTQQKVINNEIKASFKKHNCDFEELQFFAGFATIQALIAIDTPIKEVFKEIVSESNLYGNFLRQNFIVTNVKRLSIQEISNFLERNLEEKSHPKSIHKKNEK